MVMRTISICLAITLLAGCGGGSSEIDSDELDNHGYGWEFDAISANGLKLRKPGATARDADFLEAIAKVVETCVSIDAAPPPFVIIVPKGSLGQQLVGAYMSGPPLIVLDESWADVAYPHEVLHYLINVSTGAQDPTHQHFGFSKCVMTFPH